ncbi:DUF3052 domain-containing protein [Corynebacterium heidelbergense]|uniref:DUF3052 domain-containing protein n=1 Tax=Corynebacterium heidelbergense TaxID=2055947 RepID=A0A364V5J5_9CORY|nr:DUF3052 domain-containing protein [Corynebacterium heidelbergense]RAV31912.1 DUF3052 domain-containing protein [Corynebacterium heidelbergense]
MAPRATADNGAGHGADAKGGHDWAAILNVAQDEVVQELGWDEDCDSSISEALEDRIGEVLLDADTDEMVDVVLLWWRAEDGDLVDGLVDATRNLGEDGRIWLLTPAAGTAGTVQPGDVAESAQLAGMVQTSSERLGEWQGACLVQAGKKR